MHLMRAAAMLSLSVLLLAGLAPLRALAGSLTTLYTFPHGDLPMTGLVPGPGGGLYGATNSTIYELTEDTRGVWHFTTVWDAGAAVLVGSSSALYAATNTSNTVFELTPPPKGTTRWTGAILHRFTGGKDGSQPLGLALAPDGSLVGTTQLGGGAAACGSQNGVPTGCGTLFRIAKTDGKWVETIIHAFQAGADGAVPTDSPTFDPAGNLYVSTTEGGSTAAASSGARRSPRDAASGCGTIVVVNHWEQFQAEVKNLLARCAYVAPRLFNPNGVDEILAENGPPPKAFPAAAAPAMQVVFTATGGGDQSTFCLNTSFGGCGSVALLARPSNGSVPWELALVHEFSGPDGFNPWGPLTNDGTGRVYGVAGSSVGTCPDFGCGEVFTVVESAGRWYFAVVYRFTTDAFPVAQLTPYKGKLLGTTTGFTSRGTVYELTP